MISDNLQELRKKAGLSQEQLADQLNVTRQAVSKWESGQSVPDLDKASQLAKIFGVTVDELINGIQHKEASVDYSKLYTVLTFIGLCIMWLSGIALEIAMRFSVYWGNYTALLSMSLIIAPPVIFVCMLQSNRKGKRKA